MAVFVSEIVTGKNVFKTVSQECDSILTSVTADRKPKIYACILVILSTKYLHKLSAVTPIILVGLFLGLHKRLFIIFQECLAPDASDIAFFRKLLRAFLINLLLYYIVLIILYGLLFIL